MKFLFVHQNFPGQFLHLLHRLLAEKTHEIFFITEPNANWINGVRKLTYEKPEQPDGCHIDSLDFDMAMRRADIVRKMAKAMKQLGFTPDIIVGHEGWGEMLHLPDVWPDVPRIGYQEFYYCLEGVDVNFDPEFPTPVANFSRIRAKNAVNLISLNNGGIGQTPTLFQRSTFPRWSQDSIHVLQEGVDLAVCRPNLVARSEPFTLGNITIAPDQKLITYVARDLEPYRGFHSMMRALPRLLAERPDAQVILVGGDGVSYGARLENGTWREYFTGQLKGRIDLSRIHFPGKIGYLDYLRMLQRSDVHVYLTYPFVASWSLREAMACGCAIVGSDTTPVREFIDPGVTGMLAPCLDPEAIAGQVLTILEDPALAQRFRDGARDYAERTMPMAQYLDRYRAWIDEIVQTAR